MPGNSISVSHAPSRVDPLSQVECEAAAKRYIDEGQAFLAYDLARNALTRFPDSLMLRQVSALALIRTGALGEAKKLLEPLCLRSQPDESTLKRLYHELRKILILVGPELRNNHPTPEVLGSLASLLAEFGTATNAAQNAPDSDEETLGLLARVYKDSWRHTGAIEDARRSRDIYLRSFLSMGGYWTGINAATMSWLLGDHPLARDLAAQVLHQCHAAPRPSEVADRYWLLATTGEAQLLLGKDVEAVAAYRQAVDVAGRRHALTVSSLQQLQMLQAHGFAVPADLFGVLKPPNLVVFVGHMLDAPGRPVPRFPARLEDSVRREIDRRLDELDARIGYCSAACGSDLLFIEAMQERDAEVNVILPFALEEFIQTSVAHAGPRWVARFHRALKLANSVKYVTEEPLLNDTILFYFMGRMFYGFGEIRARTLLTRPRLLTVWDGRTHGLPGGTGDIISSWPDPARITVITLDEILASASPGLPPGPMPRPEDMPPDTAMSVTANQQGQRLIKAMLFADVVGYSKLQEEQTPAFMYQFLTRVASHLPHKPPFANTWGDAIFAVMDSAVLLVEYALALQEVVCDTNWADFDFPEEMSIRIGLHAGPVFAGIDPITGQQNYYGAHVNRAARIEPVTIPGNIYASEQFVALLMMEQTTFEQEARRKQEVCRPNFACDFVGTLTLAKGFASQALYHVRRSGSAPPVGQSAPA